MATPRKQPTMPAAGDTKPEGTVDGTPPADGTDEDTAELDVVQALAELTARVENLERHTGAPAPDEAERAQVKRDEALLSRLPATYAEAVEQKAALDRQAARRTGG